MDAGTVHGRYKDVVYIVGVLFLALNNTSAEHHRRIPNIQHGDKSQSRDVNHLHLHLIYFINTDALIASLAKICTQSNVDSKYLSSNLMALQGW